ncbi:3'-5' exonuclease [Methylosinus sp. H3A]|uniref:3'-5' exonuclease n=1 Tax=Methylosinus sp. H3A TaxID=2785786 RepID=UPI0028999D3A|nr:3'-5' exonuclease [Methylosinus sp. H3A]
MEIVAYRDAQAEAAGVVEEMLARHAEGTGWQEIAILYRSSFLSRGFEEALMRARIPHVIVGDVGFYQRAEVKDALALLRLAATPDDRQSDEAFRRVINEPRRGFGAKAMQAVETEASFRNVSLLRAIDTAELPTKCRAAGLQFADQLDRLIRFSADYFGLAIFGHQWKPARLLMMSRSLASAAHLSPMIASSSSIVPMCLLTIGSSTRAHKVSAGCSSGV